MEEIEFLIPEEINDGSCFKWDIQHIVPDESFALFISKKDPNQALRLGKAQWEGYFVCESSEGRMSVNYEDVLCYIPVKGLKP